MSLRKFTFKNLSVPVAASLVLGQAWCESSFAAEAMTAEQVNQLKKLTEEPAVTGEGELGETLGQPGDQVEQFSEEALAGDEQELLVEELEALPEAEEEAELEELERFGSSFFADSTPFQPSDNAAVPEGYILGVGDALVLSIVGRDPIVANLVVDRDGAVLVPRLGPITVGGLSFENAKEMIESRISSQLVGSKGFLTMGRFKNISVFLTGEVKQPGQYSVSGFATVTQLLYQGGGISDIGSYRNVQVKKDGKIKGSFDFYDLLLRGDRSADLRLASGDVLFVPVAEKNVTIQGEVLRPAIYELTDDESLSDLLQMSGGLSSRSYDENVSIQRFSASGAQPKLVSVNLEAAQAEATEVKDGDIVSILPKTEKFSNVIKVSGAVVRPNEYAWFGGAKISDYLGSIDGDYLPEADLAIGLVVRRKNQMQDVEVLTFKPLDVAAKTDTSADLLLEPYDEIIVFFKDELERNELLSPVTEMLRGQGKDGGVPDLITITGAVRLAGEYPFTLGGKLEDLILLAGGLEGGAFLEDLEVRRVNIDDRGSVYTNFVNVDLTNRSQVKSFNLNPRDLVRVNFRPDWQIDRTVAISGEVLFPGQYVLGEGDTLGTLIERAGGLTDNAYPYGIKYLSASAKQIQEEQARGLVESFVREKTSRAVTGQTTVSTEDIKNQSEFLEETIVESVDGRLIVDFEGILAGDKEADLVLGAGDQVIVPEYTGIVSVVGEVYEPGAFAFSEGISVEDYIKLAAGPTNRARKKSAYVIQANGSVEPVVSRGSRFLSFDAGRSGTGVPAGAVIVVPPNYDYSTPIELYGTISSVVFQSVTSIAALLSLSDR